MEEPNWRAVEDLLRPLHDGDPAREWDAVCRRARQVDYLANGLSGVSAARARLLCWFSAVADRVADPRERRTLTRPLRDAGVSLPEQTWLWIALPRFTKAPASDEERVAHDVVMLETVGAAGVAGAFLEAGRSGVGLGQAIDELRSRMGGTAFLTPAGKRLGVRRMVYMRRFLKELEEE